MKFDDLIKIDTQLKNNKNLNFSMSDKLFAKIENHARLVDEFIHNSIIKILDLYGYTKFDKELPINYENIYTSIVFKDEKYNIKIDITHNDKIDKYTIYLKKKVIGSLELNLSFE